MIGEERGQVWGGGGEIGNDRGGNGTSGEGNRKGMRGFSMERAPSRLSDYGDISSSSSSPLDSPLSQILYSFG
ncbi:hypothetical protein Pcinc_029459 [Petrolisthes cinctipes]|uniref:Uncharacterized protein n=1 Tax=Petrolisthes cinctipes TaxID=88211 RepID=A0AAE1F0T0_PETCI|nr:hypothetical protein Pcinc_029459 [Petrolisthes cinctipes]